MLANHLPSSLRCELYHIVLLSDQSCGFLDNQASLSSLIRGTSTQDDVHELVQGVHLTLHQLSCRCWWEWVDTESNISDGLSRSGVLDPWTQSQDWDLVELPFPPSAARSEYLTPLEA